MNRIHFTILFLICVSLWSCGKGNDNNVILSSVGKHPVLWVAGGMHSKEYISGPSNCVECHGSDLGGGISNVSCFSASRSGISCHATSPAANPTGCLSCHGNPPPSGKHIKHTALATVTCASSCHSNLGPGTVTHANGTANVALSPTYKAKPAIAAILNPNGTCSDVSCHGGQTTPPWTTGAINVNSDCTLCHISGTTQHNSYNSGNHDFHVNNAGLSCTSCHNTTSLASSHFTHLETIAMEGPASATVGGGATGIASYIPATRSCTPTDTRDFPTGPCHAARIWP